MRRKPTTHEEAYLWWQAAIAGKRLPTHETEIHCGWFVRRLAENGPLFPARIWLNQEIEDGELVADEIFCCEVAGKVSDPVDEWPWLARLPIFEEEYEALMQQLLSPERYVGPIRPLVRWLDPAEVAADWLRYSRRQIA